MLDVLLVAPPSPSPYSGLFLGNLGGMPPLGIGYLASYLKQNGYSVKCLNLLLGLRDRNKFRKFLLQHRPTIIGFSTSTETFRNGVLLAELCKNVLPNVIIIFGGPHVTFLDREALENRQIDIIVRNEGEITIVEVANYFIRQQGSLEDIKGITYRRGQNVVRNERREFIKDLDSLPFPTRTFSDLDDKLILTDPRVAIITARGCPHACKFCAASAMSGGQYRKRTPENVVEEIEVLKKQNKLKALYFGDDTVTADVPRLLKLCGLLKKSGIMWSAESRVDVISKSVARIMAKSGCVGLQFGVESGSQEMLNAMSKKISISQIEKAITCATAVGITVVCSMMVGTPWDTIESIRDTIEYAEFLQKNYKVGVLLGICTPFPGTYIFNHQHKLAINISTKNYNLYSVVNPIMDIKSLNRWQIRSIYFDAVLRLFATAPRKIKDMFGDDIMCYLKKQKY